MFPLRTLDRIKMNMRPYLFDSDGTESLVFVKFYVSDGVSNIRDALRRLRDQQPLRLRRIVREEGMTVLLEACHAPKIIVGRSVPRQGKAQEEIDDIVRVLEVNGVPCAAA